MSKNGNRKERFVYFVSFPDVGTIKIGCSEQLSKRIASFGLCKFLGAIRGDSSIEKKTHQMFEAHRLYSEFFEDCEDIRSFIRKNRIHGIKLQKPRKSPKATKYPLSVILSAFMHKEFCETARRLSMPISSAMKNAISDWIVSNMEVYPAGAK